MKAEEMWQISRGEGITVAVIDSGVTSTGALEGRLLPGVDFTDRPGGATKDYTGHGTSMAELIAGADSGAGIRGLAPSANILPLRVSITLGEEIEWSNSDEDPVADAVRVAADSDARIISMSISAAPTRALDSAIEYAVDKGKLIFASTGNNGDKDNNPEFPASYADVVGVGAVTQQNRVAQYSQHGHTDLTAPGSDIPNWCDANFTRYCTGNGTSNATAIASGSAALIWSRHPDWTANQVLRVMMETASKAADGSDYTTKLGYGTVRPRKVLLDGEGDPGDPDQHPLLKQEESPSPSAQPEGGSSDGDESPSERVKVADQGEDGPPTGLLVGSGVAVVLLAAGVIGFLVLRRR
ncbi:type VII secretion-associated serine protease mycosin [Streptomyces chumphonensis]